MDELNDLLMPVWGPQKSIFEGWGQITDDEKKIIKARLADMFKNGLPLELKHDKLMYIYVFSLLAQLEVIAIQLPLKFESKMTTPALQKRMRIQLIDEIFHALVFAKIVRMLCESYAFPPSLNENAEKFCEFIRNETCPKVAVVLLNLVAEGWIEELFKCFQHHNIAPKIFDVILEDERRHVSDADLYAEIGLPDKKLIIPKLEMIEQLFLGIIFFQYNMGLSFTNLVGMQGMFDYVHSTNKKHIQQLKKLNLTPGDQWQSIMRQLPDMFKKMQHTMPVVHETPITPFRKALMSQWNDPSDPTMVGQFNLDVTCLDFFDKKYPPETLTTLMLQTTSQFLEDNPDMRLFLHHKKLYHAEEAYVGLVVKLPGCKDHMGSVVFKNCHKASVSDLANRIKRIVGMMVYCYKKREQLEHEHPWLMSIQDNVLLDMKGSAYGPIHLRNPVVCVSNIGSCGYSQAKSPLLANEAVKITLMEVERRQVWNKETKVFDVRDQLPISMSADHRVFDGNLHMPKIMAGAFQMVYQRMTLYKNKKDSIKTQVHEMLMEQNIDKWLSDNLAFGYMLLTTLQTMWPDYLNIEEFELFSRSVGSGACDTTKSACADL